MQATYGKLNDGTWGLRVEGGVPGVGASVAVTKRDGSTKTEVVGSILWQGTTRSGKPGALCTIAGSSRTARPGKVWDGDKFNGYGARRGGYSRACKTGGNCSSFGSGRSCGAPDCDGY